MCCDTTARQSVHRDFDVEFLRDAAGTLALPNEAWDVTAVELHRSMLCAQQMMLSTVVDVQFRISRLQTFRTPPRVHAVVILQLREQQCCA